MHWNNYLACFFSGLFLANAVPHYVKGVCGDKFPTPFAKPPGIGLSSAIVNTLWGLLNIVIGYVLFRAGKLATGDTLALSLFFVGIAVISVQLSLHFTKKHAQ